MTSKGRPELATLDASRIRLAIAATRWNAELVDSMVERSLAAASAAQVETPLVVRVAGSVELPVVVQELAGQFDAVVALGVVIRGDTPHFDYVCDSVTQGLTRVALDTRTPVGNGVLTCNTLDQALARAGGPDSVEDKGWDAAMAALDVAVTLRALRNP